MLASIRIQPDMPCEYICQQIQAALVSYHKSNQDLSDCFLVIDIKKVSNDSDLIPKIEHKTN
jgi:GTP-binding protein EngB required for normal cell division